MDAFPMKKRVSFVTTSRADYAKIKPFLDFLLERRKEQVELFLYATGGHVLKDHGETGRFIQQDFQNKDIVLDMDTLYPESDMTKQTAHVLSKFGEHIRRHKIEYVFIHGDRTDAMGAALSAALNNLPIVQIEAGDISGALDEALRHAITKLSHKFFVTDARARETVMQLGENPQDIFVIGNTSLAAAEQDETPFEAVKEKYGLFDSFGLVVYHPLTTLSPCQIARNADLMMQALAATKQNYIVIYPNHERGSREILSIYETYRNNPHFCFFKSLRFNEYNALLKQAAVLIGNSSSGIMEAPVYGVPVINLGNRQKGRAHAYLDKIIHVPQEGPDIIEALKSIRFQSPKVPVRQFREEFVARLESIFTDAFWKIDTQKTMRLL